MNNNKDAKLCTKPKQDETIFTARVVGIVLQTGLLVGKNSCRFIKGDTMLTQVFPFLAIIPLERHSIHIAIILLIAVCCKRVF